MENRSYTLGRFLGKHWVTALVITSVLLLYIFAKTTSPVASPTPARPPTQAQIDANAERLAGIKRRSEDALAGCNTGAKDMKKAADAEIKAGNPVAALNLIKTCHALPLDPANLSMLDAVKKSAEKADAEAIQRAVKAEKQRLKKEGVAIGMTPEQVIASSWGKPRKINRTTGANYEHEQWVYDGGYLYFKGGILTTVQN